MGPDHPRAWQSLGFFRVGDYLVRPSLKSIRRFLGFDNLSAAEGDIRVPDKAMSILLLMAERHKEVCSREFLLDSVWGPDRDAYDRVLDNAIRDIRRAFADSARDSRYIETIPKMGYRLIAEVEWPEASDHASGSSPAHSGQPGSHVTHDPPDRPSPSRPNEETRTSSGAAVAQASANPDSSTPFLAAATGAIESDGLGPGEVAKKTPSGPGTPAVGQSPRRDEAGTGTPEFDGRPASGSAIGPLDDDEEIGHPADEGPHSQSTATDISGAAETGRTETGATDSARGRALPGSEQHETWPDGLRGDRTPASATARRSQAWISASTPALARTKRDLETELDTRRRVRLSSAPMAMPPEQQYQPARASRPRWRWATIFVLSAVASLLVAVAIWTVTRPRADFLLRFDGAQSRATLPGFESFDAVLIEHLLAEKPCGKDHVAVSPSRMLADTSLSTRIEPLGEHELRVGLQLEAKGELADWKTDFDFPRSLERDSVAAALAASVHQRFDLELCENLVDSEQDRISHCLAAARWIAEHRHWQQAQELLGRILEQWPDQIQALELLANLLHDQGNGAAAARHLTTAVGLASSPVRRQELELQLAEVEGRFPDAKDTLRELRGSVDGNRWDGVYGGWLLTHERRCQASKSRLMDAGQAVKRADSTHFQYLGNAQMACGEGQDAIDSFRAQLRLEPHNARAAYSLGRALRTVGRIDEAEQALRQGLRIDPQHLPCRLEKIRLEMDRGSLEEASIQVRRLLGESPWPRDLAEMRALLAKLARRRGDPAEALLQAGQAMVEFEDSAEARWLAGLAHIDAGQLDEARVLADELYTRREGRGTLSQMEYHHHLQARLASAEGRHEDATAAIFKALSLGPEDRPFFLTEAGNLFAEAGIDSRAMEMFEEAIAFDPGHVDALCNAARIAERQADQARAKSFLRQASEVMDTATDDPEFAACRQRLLVLDSALIASVRARR